VAQNTSRWKVASRPALRGELTDFLASWRPRLHETSRSGPIDGAGRATAPCGRPITAHPPRPIVSVIVPCFNAARFLGQTLQALTNQSMPPHEVIVVDNGSGDASPAIAACFGPLVRLVHEPRRGANHARIAGARHASGEALMFLDADDLIDPYTIEALAVALAHEPEAVAICPWRRLVWEGASDDPEPGTGAAGCWFPAPPTCARRSPEDDDLAAWLSGWWHPPCSVLWSRTAFMRSGGWDPELSVNQDGDLMMRGLVAGNRIAMTRVGTGFYRRLPGKSTSVSSGRSRHDAVADRIGVLERIEGLLAARRMHGAYVPALRRAWRLLAQDGAQAYPEHAWACGAAISRLDGPEAARAPTPLRWDQPAPVLGVPHARRAPSPKPLRALQAQPLVSVVIPTYNRSALVTDAIRTVLAQDYPALEVLVVDDASTDDTPARVAGLADERVRLIRQPVNGGVARARNRGMDAARGEIIAFLDSDDEWLSRDKLSRQVALLMAAPRRTALVYGGQEVRDRSGNTVYVGASAEGRVFETMLARNVLTGFSLNGVMRREVFETIGGFDPRLPAIEDWDFLIRATRFFDVAAVDAPLCLYRDDTETDGAGKRRSMRFSANMKARKMLYRRYRIDMRETGAEVAFLKDSARRHLGAGLRGRYPAAAALLRAIRREPFRLDLYVWMVTFALPRTLAHPLRQRFSGDMPTIG
jgi:O-antigen biosynthesis protein